MKETINYACSFGTLCQSAEVLKRNHLKLCSFPFDWVFSDYSIIIDCLQDNFAKFLDKQYYINNKHQFNNRQCAHSIYHEDFFFHKNPRNDDDYQYYARCVDRFKTLLSKDEKKLFFSLIVPEDTKHPKTVYEKLQLEDPDSAFEDIKKDFETLNQVLLQYTQNYIILVILNKVKEERSHKLSKYSNIHLLELSTISKSNGVKFIDEEDNLYLDNIINQYYSFNLYSI